MTVRTVSVEEETLRTLLTLVQGGPGHVTDAQRDLAVRDALEALDDLRFR